MRLLHFVHLHLHLHLRLPADDYSPRGRTGNRLSHPNPTPESLPARHSHLAYAPLNSLGQFPGPVRAARMTGRWGHLPSPIARHAFPMRRAFLSRTITAISGKRLHIRCGASAEPCRPHERQSITAQESTRQDNPRSDQAPAPINAAPTTPEWSPSLARVNSTARPGTASDSRRA